MTCNPQVTGIRVAVGGSSAQSGVLKFLQEGFAGSRVTVEPLEYRRGFWKRLSNIDVVQFTAFSTCAYWVSRAIAARVKGKPVVRYWVGSDVLALTRSKAERRRARVADLAISANVVQWNNLQRELEEMGIASHVLPAPHAAVLTEPVKHLPEQFTALAYLSEDNWELYGGDLLLRLAAEKRSWRFLIVSHRGIGLPALPNVEYLGFASDMDSVYRRASVLVRITTHDGLPRMVMEALACGLHVVWNQPLPHCHLATTYEEVAATLESLSRNAAVNSAGSEYALREFHPRFLAEKWHSLYSTLL